jgi:hypothetical protein
LLLRFDVVLTRCLVHIDDVRDRFDGRPVLILDDGKDPLSPVALALTLARLDDIRIELPALGPIRPAPSTSEPAREQGPRPLDGLRWRDALV